MLPVVYNGLHDCSGAKVHLGVILLKPAMNQMQEDKTG